MKDQLLTIEQTAEKLNTSAGTVRNLLPRLGAVDLNQGRKGRRLIRIPESRLEQFIRSSTICEPIREKRIKHEVFHIERRREA